MGGGTVVLTVTKEHLLQARLSGACDSINEIKEGTSIDSVAKSYLDWFSARLPDVANSIGAKAIALMPTKTIGVIPLSLLGSRDGSGYGDGYGDGYGYGDGLEI